MFCPKCKYEYIPGIEECPDCKEPLVEKLPQAKVEYVELVTVYETSDPGLIAVIKSLLESEGIRHYAKGEDLQNLFGLGTFGTGFSPLMGGVEIQVGHQDVEIAKDLLRDISDSTIID